MLYPNPATRRYDIATGAPSYSSCLVQPLLPAFDIILAQQLDGGEASVLHVGPQCAPSSLQADAAANNVWNQQIDD